MATLDDLVDVLTRIADKMDLLPMPDKTELKVRTTLEKEYQIKAVMDLKGVDESTAKAIIESWKV